MELSLFFRTALREILAKLPFAILAAKTTTCCVFAIFCLQYCKEISFYCDWLCKFIVCAQLGPVSPLPSVALKSWHPLCSSHLY